MPTVEQLESVQSLSAFLTCPECGSSEVLLTFDEDDHGRIEGIQADCGSCSLLSAELPIERPTLSSKEEIVKAITNAERRKPRNRISRC